MRSSPAPSSAALRRAMTTVCRFVVLCSSVALFSACAFLEEHGGSGMRTDEAPLSMAVAEALEANPQTNTLLLTVTNPSEGKVRLEGLVNNDGQRVAAEQVATRVDGVKSVINTLYLY